MPDGSAEVTIMAERADSPGVQVLIEALDAYLRARYPEESCHLVDIDALHDPSVIFLVARRNGAAIGCGAVVAMDGYGEIKRMYVAPEARGLKLGRRLLGALEDTARARHIAVLRLETGIDQPEAIGLYETAGFQYRPPYGDYKEDPLSLFMEKAISD